MSSISDKCKPKSRSRPIEQFGSIDSSLVSNLSYALQKKHEQLQEKHRTYNEAICSSLMRLIYQHDDMITYYEEEENTMQNIEHSHLEIIPLKHEKAKREELEQRDRKLQKRCKEKKLKKTLHDNEMVVRFRSLEKPNEDEFCLELSKLHNYDDVVGRVAHHLGLDDPSKIRLTSHDCFSQQPKVIPIKYRGVDHLSDMLVDYNQTFDILYYEILDIPLPELQGLKTLEVAFHHATKDEVVIHTIRLPKESTVGDMINDLKTKVELSNPDAELRLLKVLYHKIYEIFPHSEKIEYINDQYLTLHAEEIPEEERNLGPHDRLIRVYHFMKDTAQNQVQNFGEPFLLVIHEGETLAEVKVRIQKKLQVPDEEFAEWKFAYFSYGHPEYLQATDIVSVRFQRGDVYASWEEYLGLEHSDDAPERSYTASQEE